MVKTAIECGGGKITSKITYVSLFALCMIFSTLPFAGAAEIQNTDINQYITKDTSVANAVTDQGLKIGASGKYVIKLQKWLKNQGYYTGAIDGSFGPYTKEAVKFFQNDTNIVVDGWVANQTVNVMEDLTGINIFVETSKSSTDSSTSSSSIKSTIKSSTTKTNVETNIKGSTKVSTTESTTSVKTSTKSSTVKTNVKTGTASTSTLSQILASGAKYGYSNAASTASSMARIGSGDCWAMSDYLYGRLSAAGIKSRIVQYSTAYSSRHRSVQLYKNGAWVDVPYSSYGYNTLFKATSSKPGLTVIAS